MKPALILVGEAFGEQEEREGAPFVGAAGNLLNWILRELTRECGFPPRSQLYITNLINERPNPIGPNKNDISPYYAFGQLTSRGQEARAELLGELSRVECPVILTLGETATFALTDRYLPITKWRGSPLRALDGRILVPTLHPSYVARAQRERDDAFGGRTNLNLALLLAYDLKKALNYRREPPKGFVTTTVHDPVQAVALLQIAAQQPFVAFDIEAPGNSFACFALCWQPDRAYSIPLTTGRSIVLRELKRFLEAPQGPRLVLQNGNYDTSFLDHAEGIRTRVERMEDTMYLHHVMFPDLEKSLKLLASLYTDVPFYKDDYGTATATANPELLYEYNAKDALVTFQCWQHLTALPQFVAFEHTYRALTMENLEAAQAMQRAGFRIDHRAWADLRVQAEVAIAPLQQRLNELTRHWRDHHIKLITADLTLAQERLAHEDERLRQQRAAAPKGEKTAFRTSPERKAAATIVNECKKQLIHYDRPDFNVSSNPFVQSYFTEVHGVVGRRSKTTGDYTSFDHKYLLELARETTSRAPLPEATLVLAIREQRKQLEAFLNAQLDERGRFRFSINIRGTKYGRFSSSEFLWRYGGNVMNLPHGFRRVFIADAPDPDWIPFFVNMDQSKAEYVHVAYLANEPAMLDALAKGLDVHAYTAHRIAPIPLDVIAQEAGALGETTNTNEIAAWRLHAPCWQVLPLALRNEAERLSPDSTLRQFGKKRNHAWNYRESAFGYALRTGTTLARAREIDLLQAKAFPRVVQWQERVKMLVQRDHQLVNCFGRVIPLRGPLDDHAWNSACSAQPQSGVADATARAMRLIHAGRIADIRNNIYDALLMQLYIGRSRPLADEAKRLSSVLTQCRSYMTPELCYDGRAFHVGIDVKLGLCWGALSKIDDLSPEALLPHLQTIVEAAA